MSRKASKVNNRGSPVTLSRGILIVLVFCQCSEALSMFWCSGVPFTARKTIFPRFWNIMESSKRPCTYRLSISTLAEKKKRISHHRKVQNKNFSVTSKYHLSINVLAQKNTIFVIPEKIKTRTFQ